MNRVFLARRSPPPRPPSASVGVSGALATAGERFIGSLLAHSTRCAICARAALPVPYESQRGDAGSSNLPLPELRWKRHLSSGKSRRDRRAEIESHLSSDDLMRSRLRLQRDSRESSKVSSKPVRPNFPHKSFAIRGVDYFLKIVLRGSTCLQYTCRSTI